MFTISSLYKDGYDKIPIDNGIYIVKTPTNFTVNFTNTTTAISEFRSRNLLYDQKLLETKYSKLIDKDILYIGKAGCRKGLRERLKQYIEYGYKCRDNHRGGRAIWQIENCYDLLIDFYCCEDCEKREKELLKEYKLNNRDFPLANWRL